MFPLAQLPLSQTDPSANPACTYVHAPPFSSSALSHVLRCSSTCVSPARALHQQEMPRALLQYVGLLTDSHCPPSLSSRVSLSSRPAPARDGHTAATPCHIELWYVSIICSCPVRLPCPLQHCSHALFPGPCRMPQQWMHCTACVALLLSSSFFMLLPKRPF